MRDFLQWLLNADGSSLSPDAELSLRFNAQPEGWMVFLMAIGVIAFAVWIYRRDGRGTASPLFRTFLGVLRALIIAIAIFILTEPVLLATKIETRRSVVLVMVDDSFSMDLAFADAEESLRKKIQTAMGNATVELKLADGKTQSIEASKIEAQQYKNVTRLDVVSAALRNSANGGKNFLDALSEQHDIRFALFSKTTSSTADDGKAIDPKVLKASSARGGETRIGDSLRAAVRELRGQPLAGVVLIGDGRQNGGEDAVQAAANLKTQRVPIYTVGVGDPSEPKDFEVTAEGPDMILPDDQSEVTALIRYKGYTGVTNIRVELLNGTQVISSEEVKLGRAGEKIPIPLRFRESKPGKYTYTIKIPEQQGELRAENNTATYSFQVVDKKVKVLFVEGQDLPRWEYRYLKNALRRDHTTEVDVLLSSADGTFLWDGSEGKTPLEQFPINKKEISEYDVLIFGDVSPSIFTPDQGNLVRDFVREGGGFILIAGERYAPAEYNAGVWAEMLPIVPQRSAYQVPEGGFQDTFPVELTNEGRRLAWTHMDSEEGLNREIWENLPRLFWYFPVKRKKELATTVAVHPFDKDETNEKMPLIVTMPYGSGRTMYIGTDSLWRWRRGMGDRYFYRFYNQAIRHLSMAKRLGGQRRFYLGTDRNIVALGDRVIVNAVLKDENYRELTAESAIVQARAPDGSDFPIKMTRLKDRAGNYEGNFFPTQQGDYALWLKDEAQPDARQSELSLKVEKPQLEFENPRLDVESLQNIARAGGDGGAYFEIDKLHEIPTKIKAVKLEIPRETAFDLWSNWLVFGLFTLLITLEWVLRKRGRMI